ncbi:uncharacterized protein YjbI with pentapeptide repeats [Roseibium hamelinense]|uniref:Uncharacterized protein YjbI with pentapeptide repeats n=1 Tax=Roseibium hamelinense TaxID=150831 RepID=A0A562SFN6_9HYPH|nr:DUF2169 domain-containing protein [Roseibium hamelinense]MTI42557.1 pentapeptide repeat-containing protein [Roseibium hamelinense]TWI79564.1 uncharacterized protein YjbI with pentapeptide repeats [Roseibium hamelinense]
MPAIIKPTRLSVAHQTEPTRQGALTTVSAYALFDFSDPNRLLTEQALWPMVTEQMPNGAVFDKGQLKPKAELIVAGCALSPAADEPIEATRVTVRFQGFEKTLAVFGDRFWRLTDQGIQMSRPIPFSAMPIGDVQAFGAPGYGPNARGKGHGARKLVDAGYDAPLPNVEDARVLIKSVDDTPPPAHFGPLPADDAQRLRYLGTYDQNWVKNVSPLKPADFNPLYHCEAPEEQRFGEFFEGGETFSVFGMSRGTGQTGGVLPRLRARCFYHDVVKDEFIETTMRCDTVTLFPNVDKATLAFRGLVRGTDRFAEDIGTIMVALEAADQSKREPAYYFDVFQKRTSKVDAHKYALADYQLMPERDPAEISAKRRAKLEKAKEERDRFLANQDWAARKNLEDEGLPSDLIPPPNTEIIDDLPLVGLPTQEELETGDLDLAELLDDMKTLEDALLEKRDREMARAELQRRAIVEASPAGLLPEHAKKPIVDDEHLARFSDVELEPQLIDGLDSVAEQMEAAKGGIQLPDSVEGSKTDELNALLQAAFDDIENDHGLDADAVEEHYRKAVARVLREPEGSLLYDARKALGETDLSALDALENDEVRPPDLVDETLRELIASSGADPSPAEPSKKQDITSLTRADLLPDNPYATEAEKARNEEMVSQVEDALRSIESPLIPKEEGADVIAGLMQRVGEIKPAKVPDYEGMSPGEIARSSLEDTQQRMDEAEEQIEDGMLVARQQSPAPIFPLEELPEGVPARVGDFVKAKRNEGHDFKGADLAGADLRGMDFSGQNLANTFFENCDLTGADFSGSILNGAVFSGACLDQANLSHTKMVKTNLSQATLRNTILDGAVLDDNVIIRSDLSGVRADGADLTQVRLIECTLDAAAFTSCNLSDIQIVSGSADGFSAKGCRIERTMFVTIKLGAADFSKSSLERVGFTEISAAGSSFSGASLVSVGFLGDSDLTQSDFTGVKAVESSWNTARMGESCFLRAECNSCFFNACKLEATDFRLSYFQNSLFGKSVLTDSDFFGAHLFAAALTGVDLRRCSMRSANLYAANLLEAKLASCDFTGANLALTMLEQPTHA